MKDKEEERARVSESNQKFHKKFTNRSIKVREKIKPSQKKNYLYTFRVNNLEGNITPKINAFNTGSQSEPTCTQSHMMRSLLIACALVYLCAASQPDVMVHKAHSDKLQLSEGMEPLGADWCKNITNQLPVWGLINTPFKVL